MVELASETPAVMLPATLVLAGSKQTTTVREYLPSGQIVRLWVAFDDQGVAEPVVVSRWGDMQGLDPEVVPRRIDTPDAAAMFNRLEFPRYPGQTERSYRKSIVKLENQPMDVPEAYYDRLERYEDATLGYDPDKAALSAALEVQLQAQLERPMRNGQPLAMHLCRQISESTGGDVEECGNVDGG